MASKITKLRRGRPPKVFADNRDTRAELIRSGVEHLTEIGFASAGIDKILKKVGVPKGSFYFYFPSKEAFGHEVLTSYANYFEYKLDTFFLDTRVAPVQRITNYVEDAKKGMLKHDFKKGCLVGNLGQEVDSLPESFRGRLIEIFSSWQSYVARCLSEAQSEGELSEEADCERIAEYFWTGWEGAVSRAKLEQNVRPLDNYLEFFINGLPK